MARAKSGKEIVAGLQKTLKRVKRELFTLGDCGDSEELAKIRFNAAHGAIEMMREATRVLEAVIGDAPARANRPHSSGKAAKKTKSRTPS